MDMVTLESKISTLLKIGTENCICMGGTGQDGRYEYAERIAKGMTKEIIEMIRIEGDSDKLAKIHQTVIDCYDHGLSRKDIKDIFNISGKELDEILSTEYA